MLAIADMRRLMDCINHGMISMLGHGNLTWDGLKKGYPVPNMGNVMTHIVITFPINAGLCKKAIRIY